MPQETFFVKLCFILIWLYFKGGNSEEYLKKKIQKELCL